MRFLPLSKVFAVFLITSCASSYVYSANTLSCSVTTAAGCTGTIMLRMASSTNAHAEVATGTSLGYANNVVCCSGVPGLSNVCSQVKTTILQLSSSTNAHVQQNDQSGYTTNACMSVASGGYVLVGYRNSNCVGYDTTMASISSADNAHIGDGNAYTLKVCGSASDTAQVQSLTFSLSTNAAYFGGLTSVSTRYASSTDQNGASSEVEAHTFSVATNASSGYMVSVLGQTLTSQQNQVNTVNAIGGTNTASSVGTEQFGLRVTVSSGTGSTTAPYDGSGFAYAATATSSSQVVSGAGDAVTTVYSARYIANIAGITESGSYVANVVYVATANF